jgi:hypothetical protein
LALLLASGVYVLRVASILAADLAIALAQADACGCRPMARTVVDELKRRKRRAQ